MVHTVVWRVGSPAAVDFWESRLRDEGLEVSREGDSLRFADPEGLGHELVVNASGDEPLSAEHPEIPAEHALQGFDSVRAYSADPEASRTLLEDVLGAAPAGEATWELRGDRRGGTIRYEQPPAQPGDPGAGTVHHVAWGTTVDEHPRWHDRVAEAGVRTTPVIDRHYFHSIYFREPSGVLFEIADDGPGFTIDVPLEELGTKVILPPFLESQREQIEARLTPLPDPRAHRV
jgi:glyoxalase family protein